MKRDITNNEKAEGMEEAISIIPLDVECVTEEDRKALLELQLLMATSSINHEYARLEFEDTADQERRDELLDFMNECRTKYFEARKDLESYDPYAVMEFEQDLIHQKQVTMGHYSA